MDYNYYIDLISKEKYEEATKYKSLYIPDVLYKYCWLDDDKEKNEQRLSTLAQGQIYLSKLESFNEPFEGKAFIFDEEELLKKGWEKGIFENFIKELNDNARICCFTNSDEKQQNMPMWAYYANNHQGFCVEYKLSPKQKKFMYPVAYDTERINGNVFIGNLLNGVARMIIEGKDSSQMSGEISAYNHLAYLSLTYKHVSWRHEKEIRALVPVCYGTYFQVKPSKIYIGMLCNKANEQRLIEIANSFKECEVYKMYNAKNDSDFLLQVMKLD